ncbi:protein FAM228B-like isoform X7 [Mytilus californianus]|uniref:protein FAM228B-like isoform X7 n=1 Tax=Mytilus californianus TaxID=6549 RepID=UPI0022455E70|nr:protein FAM228B-like isoform X7 [Mytilus californianus]
MASLLCVKQQGGKLQVHNNDAIEELMIDSQDHITTTMMNRSAVQRRRSSKRPYSTPAGAKPGTGMDSKSLIGQTLKVQDWLNEKTVKSLQEKSDVESKAARQLYNPLLETESTFVKDLEEYVCHKDVMELRKKEMLHKKWNDRVHEPLRKKIIDVMDGDDWPELDRRKRELHKQYLEFVNEKGHVFLDTMDPREYYAQALNGHRPAPIKVQTQKFRDPLLSQGRERSEEERTIMRCMTGYNYTDKDIDQVKLPPLPLVPLGRHGTDSIKWLQMPLHNIESTPRMASRRRMQGVFNQCNVDFEEWSQSQYNHSLVDEELHIQKKRMFTEVPPFNRPPKKVQGLKKCVSYDSYTQVIPEDMFISNMDSIQEEKLAFTMEQTQNGIDQQTMSVS